jgi:hypothetical protein
VFVGGATLGLWITDPAAPEPRPTKDVDLIVEVASRGGFHEFESACAPADCVRTPRAASSAAGGTLSGAHAIAPGFGGHGQLDPRNK